MDLISLALSLFQVWSYGNAGQFIAYNQLGKRFKPLKQIGFEYIYSRTKAKWRMHDNQRREIWKIETELIIGILHAAFVLEYSEARDLLDY